MVGRNTAHIIDVRRIVIVRGAKKIFSKWGLDFSVIGKTTNSKNLVLNFNDEEVANLPLNSLSNDVPIYDRKWKKNIPAIKENLRINYKSFKILESLKKRQFQVLQAKLAGNGQIL